MEPLIVPSEVSLIVCEQRGEGVAIGDFSRVPFFSEPRIPLGPFSRWPV